MSVHFRGPCCATSVRTSASSLGSHDRLRDLPPFDPSSVSSPSVSFVVWVLTVCDGSGRPSFFAAASAAAAAPPLPIVCRTRPLSGMSSSSSSLPPFDFDLLVPLEFFDDVALPPLLLAFALDPPPECVDALRFFPPASTPGRSPFLSSAAFATGQPGIPGISPSCAPSGRCIEK